MKMMTNRDINKIKALIIFMQKLYVYLFVTKFIQSLTQSHDSKTEYIYNHPLKKLTAIINKNSSQQKISSYNYTYFTSGETTDLIWRETVSTGEAINTFVAGTTTYTNNSLNQVTSAIDAINAKTFLYDDDGNMTTGFTPEGYTLTMTYDAENRMTSAEYTDSGSVVHRTEYSYSGDSLLAEMKKYDGGILISTTRYLRAGFLPVQERDGSNSVTREYTWGLNLGGGIGGLLNLRQNSNDYAYLYDGKGNVSTLINSSQNIVANYRYDPSGVLVKKTATIDQPYMFSTKEYDSQTGLTNYGYRFADLRIGKWTTKDPLGEYGGINLYQMTGNNPVNRKDPWGLDDLSDLEPVGRMSSPPLNFAIGFGGFGNIGTLGAGADSGFAFDSDGTACFYTNICGAIGWNSWVGGSIGAVGQVGTGHLCSGVQNSQGGYWYGGSGPGGEGQLMGGKGGLSYGRGLVGPTAGAGAGYIACKTYYFCIND